MLQNVSQGLRLGWIIWNDQSNRKRTLDLEHGISEVSYRLGSLKTVSRELAKYKLDLVGVQEVRWDKGGTEPTAYILIWKWEC
jgi:hypothetical protein